MAVEDKPQLEGYAELSRRNFLRIAAGALVALPLVDGGFIIPAGNAYAASGGEEDGGDSLEPVTKITMVSASEVGFVVVDSASGGTKRIQGASVHVVSRYNKKELSGTTDKDGQIVLDIRDLAENPDGEDVAKLGSYAFNGTVTVHVDGYREFETQLVRIEGGTGLMTPTRSAADKKPYPRIASFNEWDILYCKNTFMQSPKNDAMHTIGLEFKQLGSGQATVSIKQSKDDAVLLSTTGTPTGGNLSVNFKGKYLQTGGSEALPITGTDQSFDDDAAYEAFYLEVVQGNVRYTWPLHLMVYKGEIEEELEKPNGNMKPLNTLNTSSSGLNISWPSNLPVVGGGTLQSFMPDLMFNINLNPFGLLQFTAKTPSWGYHNDNGKDAEGKGWQTFPRKSAMDQYKSAFDKVNKMQNLAASKYGGVKSISPIKTFAKIDATVYAQLMAVAQWDTAKHFFEGIIGGQIFVIIDTSVTWDFWASFVPVTATLAFKMTTIIGLTGGFYTQEEPGKTAGEVAAMGDNFHTDFSNTGLTITFNLIPQLSIGVGVSGIASVSLRGRFMLTLVFGISFSKKADPEGKRKLHELFGYAADIMVVFSSFLFTAAIPVHKWPYRDFYDNWKGGLQKQAEDDMVIDVQAEEEKGMAALIKKMSPITSAMLEATSEFDGLDDLSELSMQAEEDEGGVNWEQFRKPDIYEPLDNGMVIPYAVYRIRPDDEMREEERMAENGGAELVTTAEVDSSASGGGQGLRAATIVNEQSSKRPVLRRRKSRIVYTPTRRALQSQAASLSVQADGNSAILMNPGIGSLGAQGGIRPTSDKMIAENVFGDPRVKIVDLHTTADDVDLRATCSFRIGSVSVNGEMRTRIILTFVDVSGTMIDDPSEFIGTSEVLDFPLGGDIEGFEREDLYDYDFDVAFTSSGDTDMVHLVVVSGRRADGDSSKFTQVATDLVFSYLNFRVSDVFSWRPTENMVVSTPANQQGDAKYHSISNLRCATDGTVESNTILVAYLDGVADTPEKIFSGEFGVSNVRVSFAVVNQDTGEWIVPDQAAIDEAIGSIESEGIFRMELTDQLNGLYTMTLQSIDSTSYVVMKLNPEKGTFTSMKQAAVLEDKVRLLPWPQQNCFLTSYPRASYIEKMNEEDLWKTPDKWDRTQWVLQKAVWVEDVDGTPILQFEEIGPDNFNTDNFGINNGGTFIFWPQSRMGGDDKRIYDDEGNSEVIHEDDLYHLMACRIYNGVFSKPFIAADLPHDLTAIEIVASRDSLAPLEVLSVEPIEGTDKDAEGNPINSSVNVWYTAIPHVKCATAIGCLAPVPFVAPGGKLQFEIAIRNDGNSYLAGCTVQLCVHDKQDDTAATKVEGSTAQITFSRSTLVESHHNPIENGEFQNVEKDFSLPPSECSIYKAYVSIPKDWTGDKYVSFVASNPVLAEGGGLTTQDDDENTYVEYSIGAGEFKPAHNSTTSNANRDRRHMTLIEVKEAVAYGSHYADSPLSYEIISDPSDPGSEFPANGPYIDVSNEASARGASTKGAPTATTNSSTNATSSTGSTKTTSPNTGDPIPGTLALGLAAAGAVGAAVAAYERRRAENEGREGSES